MKILLVDDDAFVRDMYAAKFKEAGYEVAAAENGARALEQLENEDNAVDIVLLDMVMPEMDGLTFLESATQLPSAKNVRFIVLSNQGEENDKQRASDAGAAGYIVKAESVPSDVVANVEALIQ